MRALVTVTIMSHEDEFAEVVVFRDYDAGVAKRDIQKLLVAGFGVQ
jgi:hypothetical protein